MNTNELPLKVRVIENYWIPMADGVRLAARIWLPEGDPCPAILEYLPYRKRDGTRPQDDENHAYLAAHGYACARVDIRGSGDSDGTITDEYSAQELADGVAVVRWLAAQTWCSGQVGMIGISWGGFNGLQIAALQPAELQAVVTVCSTDDRYRDDVHYMGGCQLTDGLYWGSIFLAQSARPPDPSIVGEDWRDKWRQRLEGLRSYNHLWLSHPRRDNYWKHGSVCEDYAAIRCPVFAVSGWADGYSNAVFRLLSGLEVPRKGVVGPWGHKFPNQGVPGPAIGFLQEVLRWFDRWLKNVDNGTDRDPMLQAWMLEADPPKAHHDQRRGRWVAEASWPPSNILVHKLYLNAQALCTLPENGAPVLVPSIESVGRDAGEWCAYGMGTTAPELPLDQRYEDSASSTWDSAVLTERIEVLGAPIVQLSLRCEGGGFVYVRLNDVAPDGTSARVSYGLLKLSHREGHEFPKPLVAGDAYLIEVRLNEVGYAFAPGHRIRLAVSTSCWPMVWPSAESACVRIETGSSVLELPVRSPRDSDELLRPLPAPETAKPAPMSILRASEQQRGYHYDQGSDTLEFTSIGDEGSIRLDDIGTVLGDRTIKKYTITQNDPLSAELEIDIDYTFSRADWDVRVACKTSLRATASDFVLSERVDAYELGEAVLSRSWTESVPRDVE